MSRLVRWLWAAVALALVVACSEPATEEQAILAALESTIQAVEDRSPSDMATHLAEDFAGPGGMDRDRAQAYARAMMLRYQELGVTWTMEEIVIQDRRATTRLAVVMTGRASVAGFGGRGRLMTVDLGWRLDDGEWRIVAAQWSDKLGNAP